MGRRSCITNYQSALQIVFPPRNIPRLVLIVEKRSSLLVSRNGGLAAGPGATSDNTAADEQGSHANEREDPLESDDLMEKLTDTETGREDTEGKSDCVILGLREPLALLGQTSIDATALGDVKSTRTYVEDQEAEVPKDWDRPDKNVCEDSTNKVVGVVDRESTIPVQGDKSPG